MASLSRLKQFASTINTEPLVLLKSKPALGADPFDCVQNVEARIASKGGKIIYGWIFQAKVTEFGEYFIAAPLAVWHAPDGHVLNVTPFHKDPDYHPLSDNGFIYFLIDQGAKPVDEGIGLLSVERKFYAPTYSPIMLAILKKLCRKEQERVQKLTRMTLQGPCIPQRETA